MGPRGAIITERYVQLRRAGARRSNAGSGATAERYEGCQSIMFGSSKIFMCAPPAHTAHWSHLTHATPDALAQVRRLLRRRRAIRELLKVEGRGVRQNTREGGFFCRVEVCGIGGGSGWASRVRQVSGRVARTCSASARLRTHIEARWTVQHSR